MIRDAILTCARKPTRVSLIYRTEPTTVKRVNGTVLGSVWCVDRNPFTILRIKSWHFACAGGEFQQQRLSVSCAITMRDGGHIGHTAAQCHHRSRATLPGDAHYKPR